jgi:hypothetical protein
MDPASTATIPASTSASSSGVASVSQLPNTYGGWSGAGNAGDAVHDDERRAEDGGIPLEPTHARNGHVRLSRDQLHGGDLAAQVIPREQRTTLPAAAGAARSSAPTSKSTVSLDRPAVVGAPWRAADRLPGAMPPDDAKALESTVITTLYLPDTRRHESARPRSAARQNITVIYFSHRPGRRKRAW